MPRLDEPYTKWLMKVYVSARGAVTEPPPPRARGDAGVPLLLPFKEKEDAPRLLMLNASGNGSLEWAVMANPKRHRMDEYLVNLGLAG